MLLDLNLWGQEQEDGNGVPPEHSVKNCYGTPPEYREACDEWMDDDYRDEVFDPCPWEPTEDGLKIRWKRKFFCNPPYSPPEKPCEKVCKKKKCAKRGYCITEYSPGLIDWVAKAKEETQFESERGAWLVNYANSKAISSIARNSAGLVHLDKRISFIDPITRKPKKGNDRDSIIYLWDIHGLDIRKARRAFRGLGEVFKKDV